MERVKVESSSNILSIGYADGIMHVEFEGGAVYEYQDVPAEEHRAFLAAESKGHHFARLVRPKYKGRKMERLTEVPDLEAALRDSIEQAKGRDATNNR